MFLLVKSTGKSQRADKSLEKFCDNSPVPISAPGEGGGLLTELGVAGLWVIGFKCHIIPHHLVFHWIFLTVRDCFLKRTLEGKMLRVFPTLLLAWSLNSAVGKQLHSSLASVCNSSVPVCALSFGGATPQSCSREGPALAESHR